MSFSTLAKLQALTKPQWPRRTLAAKRVLQCLAALSDPPAIDGMGNDAGQLKHQVGRGDRGDPRWVEAGRDFGYIGADDIDTHQRADDDLCIARREAADLGHRGARAIGWIKPVDVDRDIGAPRSKSRFEFFNGGRAPHFLILVEWEHGETLIVAKLDIVGAKTRATQAELHRARWVDQPFLQATAHERGMVDLRPAHFIEGIWMAVYLENTHRPIAGKTAQDRRRDGVIAADCDGADIKRFKIGEEFCDRRDRGVEIERIDRRVANIGNIAELVWLNAGCRMGFSD